MTEVWPVIHLSDDKRTIKNAHIAARCGCPGVFLIAMDGNDAAVDPAARLIRREVPALNIGINMLTKSPTWAVAHSLGQGYDATWSDYAWRDAAAEIYLEKAAAPDHRFFAAVAFKGPTHSERDPGASAREAVARDFIPMTSGSGTGVTAPFEKIERLRAAIGQGVPLAMSGVHPPTAHKLAPLVTHWLVATCISTDFYTFNESKLRYLISKASTAAATAHNGERNAEERPREGRDAR